MRQKLADLINVVFGLRKFLAWIALFLVGIWFRLKGYMDGGQFESLMQNTFVAFVAGNGVEHIISVWKEQIKTNGQSTSVTSVPGDDDIVEPDGTTNTPVTPTAGS